MEYALKVNGHLVPRRRDAQADWAAFAASLGDSLESPSNDALKDALAFLRASTPRKQINDNGQVEWDDTPPDAQCEAELILRYVCRVRNNLFHGGKFNGRWFDPERSGELIAASLIILEHCRRCSPGIDRAYRS